MGVGPTHNDPVACRGCGVELAGLGPTHRYIVSSPGCWAAFGELSARTSVDADLAAVWPRAVNTYAVQHPDNSDQDRRQAQSVAVHLLGLHWDLELGWDQQRVVTMLGRVADGRDWPVLARAAGHGWVRIDQVHTSADVARWAESVWTSWAEHHDTIRAWDHR